MEQGKEPRHDLTTRALISSLDLLPSDARPLGSNSVAIIENTTDKSVDTHFSVTTSIRMIEGELRKYDVTIGFKPNGDAEYSPLGAAAGFRRSVAATG